VTASIPFLIATPAWLQLGAPLSLLARRNFSRPVLWVAAGTVVSILGNLLGRVAAARLGNNHWLSTIDDPLMFACFLAALEEWQVAYLEQLTFKFANFIILAIYVVLVWAVEDVSTFSRFGMPMYSLALMAGGIWTLTRRAFQAAARAPLATDWFWVVGGLTLYGATTLLTQPIGAVLLAHQRLDIFRLVWDFRAVCVDLSFLAIIAGMLLPPARLVPYR
jgi:hypothetical protein